MNKLNILLPLNPKQTTRNYLFDLVWTFNYLLNYNFRAVVKYTFKKMKTTQ